MMGRFEKLWKLNCYINAEFTCGRLTIRKEGLYGNEVTLPTLLFSTQGGLTPGWRTHYSSLYTSIVILLYVRCFIVEMYRHAVFSGKGCSRILQSSQVLPASHDEKWSHVLPILHGHFAYRITGFWSDMYLSGSLGCLTFWPSASFDHDTMHPLRFLATSVQSIFSMLLFYLNWLNKRSSSLWQNHRSPLTSPLAIWGTAAANKRYWSWFETKSEARWGSSIGTAARSLVWWITCWEISCRRVSWVLDSVPNSRTALLAPNP